MSLMSSKQMAGTILFLTWCSLGSMGKSLAAEDFSASIHGDLLCLNKGETRLGAAQWAEPEKSWRTVGELMKSALPPADAAGMRPGLTLVVSIDEKAAWGALKALLMASSALGLSQARVNVPGKPDAHVMLDLPGADPALGETVDLPLAAGAQGSLMTENGGRKVECTAALLQGLVKQLPKATVRVQAPASLPALKVLGILRVLSRDAKAAAVAYLPVKEITPLEAAGRKEVQDAVERAFQGGLGSQGK